MDPVELEFPVEKLYEYQWPPTKAGEFFLLQEQVCQYLEIKSFHRKFPGMHLKFYFEIVQIAVPIKV